jgi:hypothetical protein
LAQAHIVEIAGGAGRLVEEFYGDALFVGARPELPANSRDEGAWRGKREENVDLAGLDPKSSATNPGL